jgi:hypothetical protein
MKQITKSSILKEIEDYCSNPQLITSISDVPQDISQDVLSQIPQSWLDLLSLDDVDFTKLRELWQPIVHRGESIINNLEFKLQGLVILIEDNRPPSLLYIFLNEEELFFHRGFPPLKETEIPEKIQSFWPMLPEDFKTLYSIHNGWTSFFSGAMGHKPIDEIELLSSEEWMLEPDVIKNLPIDHTKTILVFRSGGPGYLAFECIEPEPKSMIFWSNNPTKPEFFKSFWTNFNLWLLIDMESKDFNKSTLGDDYED